MVSFKTIKKAAAPGWVYLVGCAAVVGLGMDYSDDKNINLSFIGSSSDDDSNSGSNVPVVQNIQSGLAIQEIQFADSNYTVTKTYNEGTKVYDFLVEVDKDNIGADSDVLFNVTLYNDIATGTNIQDYEPLKEVKLGLTSDLKLTSTAGKLKVLVSKDDSTIDGVDTGFVKKTFIGTNAQTIDYSYNLNPNSEDLTDMREIDDVGEKKTFTLDFGTKSKVSVEVKN